MLYLPVRTKDVSYKVKTNLKYHKVFVKVLVECCHGRFVILYL